MPTRLFTLRLVRRRCAGLTLVEVLLALALISILLLSLSQFLLSMGELWGRNRQQRLFDQHVRAVTRYVEDTLHRAAIAPAGGRGLRMAPGKLPPLLSTPLLNFDLVAGDRLLPWPKGPLPDVQCLLAVERDRGLLFYWQSRWEVGFETTAPRQVVVSPLVTRLDYDYYNADSKAFTTSTTPLPEKDGQTPLPARLRLHFQLEKWTADTVVRVPAASAALPAF
jgi:prepilin-type N-terminal cleavage/methylation domain-containing protein